MSSLIDQFLDENDDSMLQPKSPPKQTMLHQKQSLQDLKKKYNFYDDDSSSSSAQSEEEEKHPEEGLDEDLDYDSQRESSAIKRVKDEIKCVSPQQNRIGSKMNEFLRGNEEQKYGGFHEDDDEEGSIRDYQNDEDDEDGNEEEAHGLDLMVVGKAMKIQSQHQRSSLIEAKDTLRE